MFDIERPQRKQKKFQCCKNREKEEYEKHEDIMRELTDFAPTKDELETHDGVVYFPKELLPADMKQDQNETQLLPGLNVSGLS